MKSKTKSPSRPKWFAAIFLSGLLLVGFLGFIFFQNFTKGEGVDVLTSFLTLPDQVISQTDNKTNILLLGRGGVFNDTPDLTDTIIVASIELGSPMKATLVSIPRDVWVSVLDVKVNHLYLLGKEVSKEVPFAIPKQEVEKILGLPIHYVAVVDYTGFIRIIDALGGIEVDVKNTFTDFKFPIIGRENDECNGDKTYACRYEALTFTKGATQMDGALALKFVRSRHSADPKEGSDIARAARQQLVLEAIQKKTLSASTLSNYQTLTKLRDIILSSIQTDISTGEAAVIARNALSSEISVESFILGDQFLYSPPISKNYGGQFVFLSKTGNWNAAQAWVKSLLKEEQE